MTYKYYTEECSLCGIEHPKRELNKLYIAFGHSSVASPKKICSVCDDCLPEVSEIFSISLPDENIRNTLRRYCKKCYHDVSKNARYCQSCGNKLKDKEKGGEQE